MAAAIVPHRQDYLPGPQSATRILVTLAPYTGRGRANRMVLPLRAVWRTNCRPLAADAAGRLPWLLQTLRPSWA